MDKDITMLDEILKVYVDICKLREVESKIKEFDKKFQDMMFEMEEISKLSILIVNLV